MSTPLGSVYWESMWRNAETRLSDCRRAYYRELSHLREQLYRKAQEIECGDRFGPTRAEEVYFFNQPDETMPTPAGCQRAASKQEVGTQTHSLTRESSTQTTIVVKESYAQTNGSTNRDAIAISRRAPHRPSLPADDVRYAPGSTQTTASSWVIGDAETDSSRSGSWSDSNIFMSHRHKLKGTEETSKYDGARRKKSVMPSELANDVFEPLASTVASRISYVSSRASSLEIQIDPADDFFLKDGASAFMPFDKRKTTMARRICRVSRPSL